MGLKLKFTTSMNPRIEPLVEGLVRPENIDLDINVTDSRAAELFQHNLRHDDFDVSEMSLCESVISRERRHTFGQGRWDWTYLPVFHGRGLLWDRLTVRKDDAITGPADLKGKRVAVRDYSMTAMLSFRALLKDLYGIEAGDITWYNLGTRGLETGLDKQPPVGVELHWLANDVDPVKMLLDGELDVVHGVQGNPEGTRPLFPDGPRSLTIEHFEKTGVEHINHQVVVQKRVLEENPWAAKALYDALAKSGEIATERARKNAAAYLYFEARDFKEQDRIFGTNPYAPGVKANRTSLDRLLLAAYEQGLVTQPVTVEDLYPEAVLNT